MGRIGILPQRKAGQHSRGGTCGRWGVSSPLEPCCPPTAQPLRGSAALAGAAVLKPFPFQWWKQRQHREELILLAWGSLLNAPYLKATWKELPYLLFPVHWGDGGLFLMLQPAHSCRTCEMLSESPLWCILQVFHSGYFGIPKLSFWLGKVILQNFVHSRS